MTNAKLTKRALLSSAVALILCFSMLLGTTYAWFTDSVVSNNNIIKSGNLDVAMSWKEATATGTYKDASAGPIFNNDKWEPGYVEAKNLKIENKGTLALKYQLILAANGVVSELADVIDVYYAEGELVLANRDLTNLTYLGNLTSVLVNASATTTGTLDEGESTTITIALKMQETAGNEYQNLGIGSSFAVKLLATQLTAENDSFGSDYDANAPYSVWNGVVPTEMPETLVVDGTNQVVHVKDAAAFAYLSTLSDKWVEFYTDGNGTTYTNYANGAGANYYYSGAWTVSLEADIDLANHPIDPVVIVFGQSTGATAFNGNYHTIRNIKTTTGLFADEARASFSNLTLLNVKATRGALIGFGSHSITNVTVKNATISGTDYVGGLVGSAYSSIQGCKVIDSSVVATGKEAGGLLGYAEANSNGSTIANNAVNNVTVYAGNRAAGLIAQVNVNVKVCNNTVDTVTVGAADTSKYQPGAIVSNALAPANIYDNTVKNATVATKAALGNDQSNLNSAVAGDADIVFVDSGNYTFPSSAIKEDTTIICTPGTVFDGNSKLNIKGATVVGATFSNPTGTAVDQTINGVFKDCVFDGSNGLRWCYAGENVVFENCVFSGDVYGVHFDGGANEVLFKDCTFSGFNALGGAITKATLDGCTFVSNGRSGYNGINLWGSTEMKNCTFVFDGSVSYEWVDAVGSNKTYSFTNCVVTDGTTERALAASDVGDYGTGNTITLN